MAPRVHRPTGKSGRWPLRVAGCCIALPGDCCAGDLIEVLQTLQVALSPS